MGDEALEELRFVRGIAIISGSNYLIFPEAKKGHIYCF